MDQRLLLAVLVLGCFAVSAQAEVCFWKQGFGCCGTDCGVFCGNCASCDDQQCGVQGDRKAELEKNRQAFFVSIAAGKDIPIDLLKKHVKEAKTLPGNKVDNTKQGVITFEDAFKMIDPDSDGDIGRGEFDRDKLYDNNLKLKLTDFIDPDAQKPANTDTAKPANTDTKPAKTDNTDTGKTANADAVKPATDLTDTGKTTTDTTQPATSAENFSTKFQKEIDAINSGNRRRARRLARL